MIKSISNSNFCQNMLFILALALAGAACDQATMPDVSGVDADLAVSERAALSDAFELSATDVSGDVAAQLAEVRRLTAPFQQIQRANMAGWVAPLSPCVAHPELGGMGYHIGNPQYLENGMLDPLMPEVLLYEPMKNGRLRLVAVEYILFYGPPETEGGDPVKGDQPWMFGQAFHDSPHVGPFGAWTLHVWLWRHNPEGMFADFNPKVSCEYTSGE
jgi:hypothetical protein